MKQLPWFLVRPASVAVLALLAALQAGMAHAAGTSSAEAAVPAATLLTDAPLTAEDIACQDRKDADGISHGRQKLNHICLMISLQSEDSTGRYTYKYQRALYDAGCGKEGDSEAVLMAKMRRVWTRHEADLKCNSPKFELVDGHILKHVVNENFEEFIDDAIDIKLPLNRIDPADGRTLLDYIEHKVQKNAGRTIEKLYQRYYDKFRAAGARHRRELTH